MPKKKHRSLCLPPRRSPALAHIEKQPDIRSHPSGLGKGSEQTYGNQFIASHPVRAVILSRRSEIRDRTSRGALRFAYFNGAVLRDFRKANKLTQEDLAPVLEICRTWLARLETGEKVPSIKLQRRIQETFVRYESEKRMAERCGFSDGALPARLKCRQIPVVSWAAAGEASDYEDLATQIDETVGTHVTDPNAFVVIVEGDSMEPEIKAGDRVVVAPNLEPRNGDIVLVKLKDGRVMLKKFHRTGTNGGTIRLLSDYLNYETLEFSVEQVRWIYPAMEFKRLMRR